MQTNIPFFGIDWNGPLVDMEDEDQIHVPAITNPLTEEAYRELCQTVSPLGHSNSMGVDIYINVSDFICQKLDIR